ncbi:hypothetical protein K0T92_23260 [Paenibacillus oenotherae]|uniref:Uncharacterized protein n=1 Tax=Paenibacillus oenotherae TaxID=1435645 RepID=A0ABS7DCI6_9BACL|nr:DUF6492 family protein [Paenibacillus oenotherae]MBW7477644.1 hypothetical protein [Paenibacillus oenotherae]
MGLPTIDILIPAIEKDLKTLPYVIDSVRTMVKHPIGKILIISPDTERMKQLCSRKGCTFINEKRVLPITKSSINYSSKRWDRSGWLYQQLLKLSGDQLTKQRYYLVIDADTVLIRPHTFTASDKEQSIFYYRKWSQPEYFRTYKRLMGHKAASPVSFVTHYMLFQRSKVTKLKQDIEARHGTSWYKAILRSMNKNRQFAFSEFETYGNYFRSRHSGKYKLRPALNKSLTMNAAQLTSAKRKQLALRYRSVSFHERKAYSRR